MINAEYSLTKDEIKQFKELKDSIAYKDYMLSVLNSPVFKIIALEHTNNIDIQDEINNYKKEFKNVTVKELNDIFKKTMRSMVIGVITDTILLKELSDLKLNDFKDMNTICDDVNDMFQYKYILGLAEPKYYKKAEDKVRKTGETNTVLYTGLIEYMKNNGKKSDELLFKNIPKKISNKKVKKKKKAINIDSNNIRL